MIKLAIVISGSNFQNRRGLMNAALSRYEHLAQHPGYDIDLFFLKAERELISINDFPFKEIYCSKEYLDEKEITIFHKIEYYSERRLIRKTLKKYHKLFNLKLQDWGWHKQFAKWLKGYDIITAHFNDAAFIAKTAHDKYKIPYFVTWHGSDIHTIPFADDVAKKLTIEAIENAECNFFVSNALLEKSDELTAAGHKEILYNGCDKIFKKYDNELRKKLKEEFGVSGKKVITFAGNLVPIKNAILLPDIFDQIQNKTRENITFWIIGDGVLKDTIEEKISRINIDCKLWGNQPFERMPDFFNCTDILVLPSKNEGMPLVVLEAMACGSKIIGSNVGGISEAIGIDNCVPISDKFVYNFSSKVAEQLTLEEGSSLQAEFSWNETAKKEDQFYKQLFV